MAWNEPGPGRDPWNQGPKKGTGSPDLEEMLKRLKARFSGSGGKTPGSPLSSLTWSLLIAALAVLWIASGFYVVDEQERGVVLRFGKYAETTQPGLRWHLPWPIETVAIVEVMKLMNHVAAPVSGVVSALLVETGAPVEFGQPIVVVDPQG